MKQIKTLFALCLIAALVSFVPSARAGDDSNLRVSVTNATVATTNNSGTIDLGTTSTTLIGTYAFIRADIPALTLATNSATTLLYSLQHSTNNSTWTYTVPLVQLQLTGASSITNTATSALLPIPRVVNRYLRIQQITPAAAGDITSKTNVYNLTIP